MSDDQFRISEFKKALRQFAGEGVVDLDENYRHKFNFRFTGTKTYYAIQGWERRPTGGPTTVSAL